MKRIKKFNESEESKYPNRVKDYKRNPVRVKDIINFLQELDPEIEVTLDKDGWSYHPDPKDTVKNSSLFHVWDHDGEKHLTINN